jgi:hypothetical protein
MQCMSTRARMKPDKAMGQQHCQAKQPRRQAQRAAGCRPFLPSGLPSHRKAPRAASTRACSTPRRVMGWVHCARNSSTP